MTLLTMLIIPTLVCLGFFFFSKHKITIGEFAAQMGIQVALIAGILLISTSMNMRDTEVWNGEITGKQKTKVTCTHTYCCSYGQCCSGSGKNRSCHTCCKRRCKRHSYDIDWRVFTNIGERFNIRRLSQRGLEEPPRWTAVKVGEPYSSTHSYKNYVKANPGSLFNKQGLVEKYKGKLPQYPQKIYDYHRLDRFVSVGVKADRKLWNKHLSEANKALGPKKQVNIVTVIVKEQNRDYFHALQQHWLGGKKNDVVVVISVDESNKARWVEVMAWTNNYMVQTEIKNLILAQKEVSPIETVNSIFAGVANHYQRKPMKEFEYLKDAAKPSLTVWMIAMVVGFLASIGLGLFFLKNDVEYNKWNKPFFKRR